jgi:serine phosphatase RsbU (regulator of sigma subunit)
MRAQVALKPGDLIILGTDGLFDNLYVMSVLRKLPQCSLNVS